MKTILLKLWIITIALIGLVACGSSETMTPAESTKWIAAYTPERIDMGAIIRIESTESLRAYMNTMRSLEKVFRFSPSVEGKTHFTEGGKYIDFIPEFGALKQGKTYECRVNLARLTGIDSLRDFAFNFAVERREAKLTDIHLYVDPDNVEQVIIEGKMIFNQIPSDVSTDSSLLTCGEKVQRPPSDLRKMNAVIHSY